MAKCLESTIFSTEFYQNFSRCLSVPNFQEEQTPTLKGLSYMTYSVSIFIVLFCILHFFVLVFLFVHIKRSSIFEIIPNKPFEVIVFIDLFQLFHSLFVACLRWWCYGYMSIKGVFIRVENLLPSFSLPSPNIFMILLHSINTKEGLEAFNLSLIWQKLYQCLLSEILQN